MVQAIDNLDSDVLHADLLPQLVATIPKADEIMFVRESVDEFGGYDEVRSRLGAAETFYMELDRVQRVLAKVKVLQFKENFFEMQKDVTVRMPSMHALHAWLDMSTGGHLEYCSMPSIPSHTWCSVFMY